MSNSSNHCLIYTHLFVCVFKSSWWEKNLIEISTSRFHFKMVKIRMLWHYYYISSWIFHERVFIHYSHVARITNCQYISMIVWIKQGLDYLWYFSERNNNLKLCFQSHYVRVLLYLNWVSFSIQNTNYLHHHINK